MNVLPKTVLRRYLSRGELIQSDAFIVDHGSFWCSENYSEYKRDWKIADEKNRARKQWEKLNKT